MEDKKVRDKRQAAARYKRLRDNSVAPPGKDCTRVSRLGHEQLEYLVNEIPLERVETHGLDAAFEKHWCWVIPVSTRTRHELYPSYVYLSGYKGEEPFTSFKYQQYVTGQVVLAYEGQFAPEKKYECSHLCGTHCCIRPEHLRWETRGVNMKRNHCIGQILCSDCSAFHDTCACIPKCIKIKKIKK